MTCIRKWSPLLIAAVAVLTYSNSFFGTFIFDDISIVEPSLTPLLSSQLWQRIAVDMSFRLNYLIGGFRAADYHVFNLAVHITAGLFLYGFARRTFSLPAIKNKWTRNGDWMSAAIAGLWLVHPLQTESVTYICQRYEAMMGMFCFMSLYCFARAQHSDRKRIWYNISLAACAVGMTAKETMVAVPVLLLLYDYLFVAGSLKKLIRVRWRVHTAMFGTWAICGFLLLRHIARHLNTGMMSADGIGPVDYLATQFGVIVYYLRMSFFPHPLCLDHNWPLAEGLQDVLVPAVLVFVMAITTIWAICRRSPLGFIGAWFFLTLAPSSSIVPLPDIMFEHRMYLPLVAVIAFSITGLHAFALMLEEKMAKKSRVIRGMEVALVCMVAVVLSVLTWNRNKDYQSEEVMWSDVVQKRPDNLRAHNGLAIALCENEKYSEAMDHYRIVFRSTRHVGEAVNEWSGARPGVIGSRSDENNRFRAFSNLGVMSAKTGNVDDAIYFYAEAMKIYPYMLKIRNQMIGVLVMKGLDKEQANIRMVELLRQPAVTTNEMRSVIAAEEAPSTDR